MSPKLILAAVAMLSAATALPTDSQARFKSGVLDCHFTGSCGGGGIASDNTREIGAIGGGSYGGYDGVQSVYGPDKTGYNTGIGGGGTPNPGLPDGYKPPSHMPKANPGLDPCHRVSKIIC
jgi:hypothetical protein